ncbi:MAG: hypothetical protein JWR52_1157 [Marmoricola sp.]|nr:hypothetical protein [Marmoricola sp.]
MGWSHSCSADVDLCPRAAEVMLLAPYTAIG